MISGVSRSDLNFQGKVPKIKVKTPDYQSNGEYIRGFRGIVDNFLTADKLEKEQFKAITSGNFAFLQGVKDALAKINKK